MGEAQTLSSRTKKLLALFVAAVILLAATVGIFWPSSNPEPQPISPATADDGTDSEANPETATEAGSETTTSPGIEAGQRLSPTDNDQLLTETYGLTLPVSVRAREIVLETHQLIADFERVNEETKEFADPTRYSCQQFETAIDPSGSGQGSQTAGILVRILESDIGLEFADTEDDPDDNEIRIVGDFSDLQPAEAEAIAGMVQRLNRINNDSLAAEIRRIDCGIGDSGNNAGRQSDINLIISNINQYLGNNGIRPEDRSDIEDLIAGQLSYYSLAQINAAGSWDRANLPVDGRFAWDDGYDNPPPPQAGIGPSGGDNNIVVINRARCDDQNRLPLTGIALQTVVIYRLEGQYGSRCVET